MPTLFFAGLRPRLMLLAILVVLPFMGLTLFTFAERRQNAIEDVQQEALHLTGSAVNLQEHLTEEAHLLLHEMAGRLEALRASPETCGAAFALLLEQNPRYVNLAAAEPDGDIFCSGLVLPASVNVADMPFFRRAAESRDFAVGDYQVSRAVNKSVLTYAYPVYSGDDQLEVVVFASLDLSWFNHLLAEIPLPPESAFTVIDQAGTILARYPEPEPWVGQTAPESPFIQTALASQGEGTAEVEDLDGTRRLYAFTRLRSAPGSGEVYVSVGIPVAVAFFDTNQMLLRDLLVFAGVSLAAIVIGWIGGEVFIRRYARALVDAARRLATGDLSARTGLNYALGEPGQLARAIDEMAAALEQREAERRQAEQTLQRYTAELEQRVAERTSELRAALEQEKQLHELKARFGSMVSHEFRNPLAAIQLSADVLKQYNHKLTDDKRMEHVERIQARAVFLSELLDDILMISRADTVGLDFNPSTLKLDVLCQEIIKDMQPGNGAPQIVFSTDASGEIMGDEKLLHQMISNLVSNAIKYSLNGGVVQVDLHWEDGQVRLRVSDQGIGIPADDMKRLFDLFHRAKNTAGIPGTGLGLAIAKRAAEAHGGSIVVDSTEGVGSTFTVRLPVKT
jgi:signal transduction histidine kinase